MEVECDHDLLHLSLWQVEFIANPVVVSQANCTTISSILDSKLELRSIGYLIDSDKIIFVVELVDGWEVFVLVILDWLVRIKESVEQFVGKLILKHVSKDTIREHADLYRPFLS